MRRSSLHQNEWKLLVLQTGRNFLFFFPILILFYQREGLSYTQLFSLQALSSLIQGGFQIPSGYIADRWGRKPTIIVGFAGLMLGCLLYASQSGLAWFALATSLVSTGMSFLSGTVEALTFETLQAEDKVDQFRQMLGRQSLLRFGGEAAAGLIGGVFAVTSLRLPFWISAIPMGLLLLLACTLEEPPRPTPSREPYFRALWQSTKLIMSDVRLRRLFLMGSILTAVPLSLYWFTQPYQELIGLPLALFGLSHAVVVLCGGLTSRGAHLLEHRLDDRRIFLLLLCTVTACYAALGLIASIWGLIFVVLMRMAWALAFTVGTDIVTRLAPAHLRATALSIGNMHAQFFLMTVPLAFGKLADVTSLQTTFMALSAFTFVSAGMAFVRWERIK